LLRNRRDFPRLLELAIPKQEAGLKLSLIMQLSLCFSFYLSSFIVWLLFTGIKSYNNRKDGSADKKFRIG
jgi:hypothetical protein